MNEMAWFSEMTSISKHQEHTSDRSRTWWWLLETNWTPPGNPSSLCETDSWPEFTAWLINHFWDSEPPYLSISHIRNHRSLLPFFEEDFSDAARHLCLELMLQGFYLCILRRLARIPPVCFFVKCPVDQIRPLETQYIDVNSNIINILGKAGVLTTDSSLLSFSTKQPSEAHTLTVVEDTETRKVTGQNLLYWITEACSNHETVPCNQPKCVLIYFWIWKFGSYFPFFSVLGHCCEPASSSCTHV